MPRMRNFLRFGDHLVTCDRSGQKALRGDCVKEWNGLIVIREYARPRHPLDLERPVPVEQPVLDSRPKPPMIFLAPGDVTPDDL